eukprot:Opistho-1_new@15864
MCRTAGRRARYRAAHQWHARSGDHRVKDHVAEKARARADGPGADADADQGLRAPRPDWRGRDRAFGCGRHAVAGLPHGAVGCGALRGSGLGYGASAAGSGQLGRGGGAAPCAGGPLGDGRRVGRGGSRRQHGLDPWRRGCAGRGRGVDGWHVGRGLSGRRGVSSGAGAGDPYLGACGARYVPVDGRGDECDGLARLDGGGDRAGGGGACRAGGRLCGGGRVAGCAGVSALPDGGADTAQPARCAGTDRRAASGCHACHAGLCNAGRCGAADGRLRGGAAVGGGGGRTLHACGRWHAQRSVAAPDRLGLG